MPAGSLDWTFFGIGEEFTNCSGRALIVAASVATVVDQHLGNVVGRLFGSPWSIALQVLLLAAVTALPFIPWRRFLGAHPEAATSNPG